MPASKRALALHASGLSEVVIADRQQQRTDDPTTVGLTQLTSEHCLGLIKGSIIEPKGAPEIPRGVLGVGLEGEFAPALTSNRNLRSNSGSTHGRPSTPMRRRRMHLSMRLMIMNVKFTNPQACCCGGQSRAWFSQLTRPTSMLERVHRVMTVGALR